MEIDKATTLRQIIRSRPMAVEALEHAAQQEAWNHLDRGFSDFCEGLGLDHGRLKRALAAAEPARDESDWDAQPIYVLIDFLTQQHDRFRQVDLPSILHMLRQDGVPLFPDKYVFKLIEQEFLAFQDLFLEHIEEEETFLFPKVMRNEACFRYNGLRPEAYKGSVNLYLTARDRRPEEEFNRTLIGLKDKLRNLRVGDASSDRLGKVMLALGKLESLLGLHTGMENRFLFPRASRMEQELYEGILPGPFRFPGEG